MNVYIIGSLTQADDIEALAVYFTKRGDTVRHVRKEPPYKPFSMIVDECFRNIKWADAIIALKKPDGEFGEGTTYELAYVKAIGKKYRYAIPADSTTYRLVNELTDRALPYHRDRDYTPIRFLNVLYLVDQECGLVFEQPKELPETIY